MLSVKNLKKSFGKNTVLKDINTLEFNEEVIETTQKVQNEFLSLVKMIVSEL